MHFLVPRLLTILSLVAVLSFVPSALALGGLVAGLVDTVADVADRTVGLIDGDDSGQEADEPAPQETEDRSAVEEATDTAPESESDQPVLGQPAADGDSQTTVEESAQASGSDSEQDQDETVLADESITDEGPTNNMDESSRAEESLTDVGERRASEEDDAVVDVDDDLLKLDGSDKHVRVQTGLLGPVDEYLGLGALGGALYTLQEDVVHGSVTRLTGLKIPHFYVWVCIDDVCLPVDPFLVSN